MHICTLQIQCVIAFLISLVSVYCFDLSIIHVNDFHARFEPTSEKSNICRKPWCLGGFSRIYSTISKLRKDNDDSILLDAGDRFQGTAWFTLLDAWNVTQYFWNKLEFDAIALGNHEFDKGLTNLADFLRSIRAPVLAANMDAKNEPQLKGLFNKSIIVERKGKKIGIIGVITSTLPEIAAGIGHVRVWDEIKAVNKEARRLRKEGCFTIIVLSHAGYEVDKRIARNAEKGISLIVGGHSHTLLYDGMPPYHSSMGPYPTVVQNSSGRKILVVQAYCCSYYVGNIVVKYDQSGSVKGWSGKPVFLDEHVETDKAIDKELNEWRDIIDVAEKKVVGSVPWDMENANCRRQECILGNFLTEAMTEFWFKRDAKTRHIPCKPVSLLHAYSMRGDLKKGDVRYIDLVNTAPYSNTIDTGQIQGRHILDALELSFTTNDQPAGMNILHQTGLRIKVNTTKETSKVEECLVCCQYDKIESCTEIEPDVYYVVAMPAFLAEGRDKFEMLLNIVNRTTGPSQLYVLMRHLHRISLNMHSWRVYYSTTDGRLEIME